jgi:hypothetical protein
MDRELYCLLGIETIELFNLLKSNIEEGHIDVKSRDCIGHKCLHSTTYSIHTRKD